MAVGPRKLGPTYYIDKEVIHHMIRSTFVRFTQLLRLEPAGGIALFIATIAALIVKNTFLATYYDYTLSLPFGLHLGDMFFSKPILLWVNDGLMAIFFLAIGLELKREFIQGHLAEISQVILPGVAALGGMVIPALIFHAFNADSDTARGWAIPVATDIAFALGVLTLLGKQVPLGLKLFLMALAVFDDLGAIIIIAIFHTDDISFIALFLGLLAMFILFYMNRRGGEKPSSLFGHGRRFMVLCFAIRGTCNTGRGDLGHGHSYPKRWGKNFLSISFTSFRKIDFALGCLCNCAFICLF